MSFIYKQIVDDREEVFQLKNCSINLGLKVEEQNTAHSNPEEAEPTTSDEEFLYLNPNSETESYDSDQSGFRLLAQQFITISGHRIPEDCQGLRLSTDSDMVRNKVRSKKNSKLEEESKQVMSSDSESESEKMKTKPKKNSKTKKRTKACVNPKSKSESSKAEIKDNDSIEEVDHDSAVDDDSRNKSRILLQMPESDQSLLDNDFFEHHMQYFMSQTMAPTQTSALIQQIGRFSYIELCKRIGMRAMNAPITLTNNQSKSASDMLRAVLGMFDEDNPWPTVLKTLTHLMLGFKKCSRVSKSLAHRLLAHYDWTADKVDCLPHEVPQYRDLHNSVVLKLVNECLLWSDYSRSDVLDIIGGKEGKVNAWPFVAKLIQFIVNQTIQQRNDSSADHRIQDSRRAMSHLKLIINLLDEDFKKFLNESHNYCTDIRGENKPLISGLIWPTKSPDYLNTVFKQLIWLIVQVFKKIPNPEKHPLLVQMFRLFDLGAECLRIASGNVRPFLSFSLNRPMPTTELLQQLKQESMEKSCVWENLMIASSLPWVTLQFSGLFLTHFMPDLKTKYLVEKHKQISLKLVVESLTNAKLASKQITVDTSINTSMGTEAKNTNSKSETKTCTKKSSHKRQSIGCVAVKQNKKYNKTLLKRNQFGENALHKACEKGDHLKVTEILNQTIKGFGPDPNDQNNGYYTPMFYAIPKDNVECVRALIEWQQKADKPLDFEAGPDKHTVLHEAMEYNAIQCAKLIIESGGPELLDIRRKMDDKTPRDLIRSDAMRNEIEATLNQFQHKSLKIAIDGPEDAKMFLKTLRAFIGSYNRTAKITKFLEFNALDSNAKPEVDQDLWSDTFQQHFGRDISETDIPFLIQELSVFLKLPQVVEHLKSLFESIAKEEAEVLAQSVDVLFRRKRLMDLLK